MNRGRPRLLPLFIIVLVVIVVIFGIVSIGRALFTAPTTSTQESDHGREALLSTSATHSVRMTARGPIVANENFTSYQITVSPTARTMMVYNGYVDAVSDRIELDNNQKAYEEFVYALDKANMMKGKVPDSDAKNDVRGICATGYVYEYEVLTNASSTKRLWTSTCDGSKGSLQASIGQLNSLFNKQIPGYEKIFPFRLQDTSLHL